MTIGGEYRLACVGAIPLVSTVLHVGRSDFLCCKNPFPVLRGGGCRLLLRRCWLVCRCGTCSASHCTSGCWSVQDCYSLDYMYRALFVWRISAGRISEPATSRIVVVLKHFTQARGTHYPYNVYGTYIYG